MIQKPFFLLPVLVTVLHVLPLYGYIPAQPSNYSDLGAGAQASTPRLYLQWYTNGSDWEHVTLRSANPQANNDPVQGIFVHFSEDLAGNGTTVTPWIAFVSCDANSTNSSPEIDVFNMAKDRGAKSAILYSLYSRTCLINPGYQAPDLDIFTTQSWDSSRRIEYEFGQSGPSTEAYYGFFNAAMLNNTAGVINASIAVNYPTAPGFLLATVPAYATNGSGLQSDANGTTNGTGPQTTSSGGPQDTGVAMIILYAITGCVSALFCGVIVSGAIKAIRHPERYGPRRADPTLGGGQTRAGGLGRAILDTFPIVKFGSSSNNRESGNSHSKDIESTRLDIDSSTPPPLPSSVQLVELDHAAEHDEQDPREEPAATTSQEAREDDQTFEETDQRNTVEHVSSSRVPASSHGIVPECIGRETCPICIVDFEEGDDLRVLPCEGKHRFHQSCVDPWLLELSASCPICRQDFRALETIISGGAESETSPANRNSDSGASMRHSRRFSRYLRFALVHQRRADSGDRGSPSPLES